MLHAYFGGRVYGGEKVPQTGPLIAVSNHGSYFDPPILSCCLRRPVAFMAKEELFEIPVLKQAIQLYGAYPVKRGAGDRSAIRSAIAALHQGWIVGIFLEGTRTNNARILNPKLGAAMIAAKAQVPLLPISLWGTERILSKGSSFPRRVPITVRIGEIIAPPPSTQRDDLQAIAAQCADRINAMHALGR